MTGIKLDENLSQHLKDRLSPLGLDVMTVEDEGLLSQPDHVVAAAAKSEGRFLLTLDVAFADLGKHPPGTHPGIAVLRPMTLGASAVSAMVESFLGTNALSELGGCVVIVEPARVRIRRPIGQQ